MRIKLFGVMGSVLGGDSDLGRNTTCLVLSNKGRDLILDSGTGILKYMRDSDKSTFHILFSHYHSDHILGFPFIPQLFDPSNEMHIYGPNLNDRSVKNELFEFIREPYFPIKSEDMLASLSSKTLIEGENNIINGFKIESYKVEHPGGCFIYNIEADGKKVSFLSDLPNGMDLNLDVIKFCSNSDLIYADSMFTEDELRKNGFLDYGHSCVESVIRFFKKTGSKKLLLGHHNSFRNYKEMKHYESKDIIISKENTEIII